MLRKRKEMVEKQAGGGQLFMPDIRVLFTQDILVG